MTLQATPRNRTAKCPHCGQNMPTVRLGVRLSPVLALIFDRVQQAGDDGVEGNDLRGYMSNMTGRDNVSRALNVRIHALNAIIEDAGYRIKGIRDGSDIAPSQRPHRWTGQRSQSWRYYLKRI